MATVTKATYFWGNTLACGGGGIQCGGDINLAGNDIDNVEDLEVNDIYDYNQGEVFFYDTIELDYSEVIRSDSYNLSIEGGTDPVLIGSGSYAGADNDLIVIGDFDVVGTKDCVVNATDGKKYVFSVIESPEVWFEEKLSGKIIDGLCEIILDERFIASTVIDEGHPLHVIVTNTADENNLWVEKFFDKVIIHGTNNSTFDITISAKRLNYEDKRFDEFVHDDDLNTSYKKSKEATFLEKKPLLLQTKTLKDESHTLKAEVKTLKAEILDEDKKEEPDKVKIQNKIAEKKNKKVRMKEIKQEVSSLREQMRIINKNGKK